MASDVLTIIGVLLRRKLPCLST